MVATPEEQKKILETLKKENLEEFFENVRNAYDHEKMLQKIIETKRRIEDIIRKYDNSGKIAFEKARNDETYVYINPDRQLEIGEPIEMTFEEFIEKYKPNLVWCKNGKGRYSTLLGKYRFFAKDYKVVIFKVDSIDKNTLKIATKLSKNIYVISAFLNELSPRGFVIFVPN